MFKWEADLWQDFKELFNLKSDITTENRALEVKRFQDATFNNKDSRVVKDSSGNIVFLYSIINGNTIVITTNTNTLNEIVKRINTSAIISQ